MGRRERVDVGWLLSGDALQHVGLKRLAVVVAHDAGQELDRGAGRDR